MRIAIVAAVAASAIVAAAGSVNAADIPARVAAVKAPLVPVTNWTGFYLSGGFGYGLWAADTYTTVAPGSPTAPASYEYRQGGKGWLGRVGLGFDYQFNPRIVAGVFGDFDFSSIEGTIIDPATALAGQIKQTQSWAVGARAGWLFSPNVLGYWTAGYTNARFSSAAMHDGGLGLIAPPGAFTGDSTPSFRAGGWFLGGGTEVALSGFGGGLFWRTEYRYAYYGDQTLSDTGSNPFVPINNSIHFQPTVQTVTTQLVYKWNAGMPAAAYESWPVLSPANWSGLYVAGGIGYGLWAADTSSSSVFVNQTQGGKGWLGRVSAGYDYQFTPGIVTGLFADFDFSSLKGTLQDQGPFPTLAGDIKQTSSWAVGARAGLVPTAGLLSYVTAGYTNARFSTVDFVQTLPPSVSGVPSGISTSSFNTDGWFVGGGVENTFSVFGLFGPGWYLRTEYRYAQYRNQALPEINLAPPSAVNFKPTVQTITTQVLYKFNWM
jgi:outer membrane immunogenic protein